MSTIAYPLVISGKPFFSWPAFIPVTFELGVLGGALGAVFGMFAFNQLPTLHHPLFGVRALRAGERRRLLHLDRVLGPALRRRPDRRSAAPAGCQRGRAGGELLRADAKTGATP